MKSLSLFIMMVLICACLAHAVENDAAVRFLVSRRPQLQDGGATPHTFAAWANARYLLPDACYLGSVTSFGDGVESHLFISGSQPVLVCWVNTEQPMTINVVLGKAAKLFAWGEETRQLQGRTATLDIDGVPRFVRGVEGRYVAEAIANLLMHEEPALDNAAATLQDAKMFAACSTRRTEVERLLTKGEYRKLMGGLQQLERACDEVLPEVTESAAGFTFLQELLRYRLHLCEARAGVAQWQGQLRKTRPLSALERLSLSDALIRLHVQAEPRTALRGYPITGQWLRDASEELNGTENRLALREQQRLAVLYAYLPYLLALESPSVQNLESTVSVREEQGRYQLVFTLANMSGEDAVGSVQLAWEARTETKRFHLVPGGKGELRYALEEKPNKYLSVQLTGVLADGTPMRPSTLTVTNPPEIHHESRTKN